MLAQAPDKYGPADDMGITDEFTDPGMDRTCELASKADGDPSTKKAETVGRLV